VKIILGNILRSLVSRHISQLDQILAQVEFPYNDTPIRSTWKSKFKTVYGMHPSNAFELRDMGKY
jgi:hypothetical protein